MSYLLAMNDDGQGKVAVPVSMGRISGTMGWVWNYLPACLTPTPKCPEAIPERVSATTRRCPSQDDRQDGAAADVKGRYMRLYSPKRQFEASCLDGLLVLQSPGPIHIAVVGVDHPSVSKGVLWVRGFQLLFGGGGN
jgi:hypothetical protein